MRSIDARAVFLFLLAVAARLGFYLFTNFTADDAFITFRYADNIADGSGFVYNVGERVLGTTTPLFTLLLALFSLAGMNLIYASLAISLVSTGVVAVLLDRFAEKLRFGIFSLLPALAYTFWPRSFASETGGMETALFTMLVTLALYLQHEQKMFQSLTAASLAALTRPEGVLLVGILVVHNIYRQRGDTVRIIALPAIIALPWLLFAQIYFGSVIPHSVIGKLALFSESISETMSWHVALRFVMAWHTPFGWLMTVAAVAGGYWLITKRKFGWLETGWVVAMVTFLTVSTGRVFFWYAAPIYPAYILLMTGAVPFVYERLTVLQNYRKVVQYGVTVGLLAILAFGAKKPAQYYTQLQKAFDEVHKAIGLYLADNSAPGDLIAAEDIGYMGYYSGRQILDRDGLVSAEVPPYNESGEYLQLILDYSPQIVILADNGSISRFDNDPEFVAAYRLDRSFHATEVTMVTDLNYNLFRRTE